MEDGQPQQHSHLRFVWTTNGYELRERGGDVEAELAVLLHDGAARLAQADDPLVVAELGRDDEPGRPAGLARDRLGKVALVPCGRAREELVAVLVDDARLAVPELREAHV